MPKKSKKSTEPKAESEAPVANESIEPTTGAQQPTVSAETEERIDQEAEHRLQNESPAPAEDGEAELEAQAEDTAEDALAGDSAAPLEDVSETDEAAGGIEIESLDDDEEEFIPAPRPPAKLERLQKILSQAGVASRRHAEELITGGRVQVNGKIVTELGTKADAGRDHIRVDGKLLQGAERQRYFVLNKPRGYVTTVSDPERRPTVMEFFAKMSERLYPVGRLDYLSEGLLLVTNDGDLANKLTKASTGVQKTYLVKVSGQPTEEELDKLRGGVSIERGKPGEGRVRTAPAAVRQVRQGDNPWYEVVLIEGRNRELRKMFEEIGHFVEKIRRVGYGPLVLDQEPGHLRELEPEELAALRLAAEGKWKAPKSTSRRDNAERGKLPTVAPAPTRRVQPREDRLASSEAPRPFPAKKPLGDENSGEQAGTYRPATAPREGSRPEGRGRTGTGSYGAGRPASGKFAPRTGGTGTTSGARFGQTRPAWKKDDRGERPPARFGAGTEDRRGGYRGGQSTGRPGTGRPGTGASGASRTGSGGSRTFGSKPTGPQPAWDGARGGDRPRPSSREPATGGFDRPGPGARSGAARSDRPRTGALRTGPARSGPARTGSPRTGPARTGPARTGPARTGQFRSEDSRAERPKFERSGGARPGGFGRTGPRTSESRASGSRSNGPARPPRAEGTPRPFPADGARPGGAPAKSSSRPYSGARSDSRGATRPSSPGKTGWKPKPSSDGKRKPAFGTGSRPPAKGSSRGSRSQSGPRPGGKRPGGKRS